MKENDLNSLIDLSRNIGIDPALVQGGGGNTSVKIDTDRMVVKASGVRLKDIGEPNGHSIVDHGAIRRYLEEPDGSEDAFAKKMASYAVETGNRPSIETGLHALLKKFVVHTHSVYANLLTCCVEGKDIAKELFPDSLWIGYETPGRDLILSIRDSLKSAESDIIFLANHGLIVTGSTKRVVSELHTMVNRTVMDYFHIDRAVYSDEDRGISMDFIKGHVLFPDQVVYTLAGEDILASSSAKEALWAYRFLVSTMREKKLGPKFLPNDKVSVLLDMESEKYRQKAIKA